MEATDEELEAIEMEEEAMLQEQDDIFIKKWSGWAILGPFVPACFSVFIIVAGSTVVNTVTGQCGAPLDVFVSTAIAICYLFLLVYSWVFLGDTIQLYVPLLGRNVTLMKPYRSLRFLMFYYLILGIVSFFVMAVWGFFFVQNETILCADTTPSLYFFSSFVLGVYWIGFFIVMFILINKKFGGDIMAFAQRMLKEPTPEEMEEKVFRKKFAEFDKDKVGYIKNDELPSIINELGIYMPDEELPDLISSLDPSSGGTIKFDDLLGWFKKMNAAAAPDEMNVITENKDQINKEDAAKASKKKS